MSSAEIADIIRTGARECPDRTALYFRDDAWTFAQLDEISSKVAQFFVQSGLQAGSRVGILDRSSHFAVAVILGAAKAGMTYVGVNWRLVGSELSHLVDDAQMDALFVGPDYREIVDGLAAEGTKISQVVDLESSCCPSAAWLDAFEPIDPARPIPDGAPSILLYSSGTTGRPKGIMLGGAGLVGLVTTGGARWGFDASGVNLVNLPFFHIGGVGWSLLGLHHRNPGVVARDAMPADLLDIIERYGVTNAFLVPTIIHMLINDPAFSSDRVQSMRTIVYGGAAASQTLLREARQRIPAEFAGSYGLTETTNGITTLTPAEMAEPAAPPHRITSVGRPHDGVSIRIIDPATGDECQSSVAGEVQVKAAQTMLGYWNLPEATERTILPGGWVRTGDIGQLDDDGYLYIVDRIVDMLISGGENVYPAEIETALVGHPAVSEVAVVGAPDERWGEIPVAFVVGVDGSQPSIEALEAWCRERVAGYKVPKAFHVVRSLPVTATGKVQKAVLRQHFQEEIS